jgi:hypothetical protein
VLWSRRGVVRAGKGENSAEDAVGAAVHMMLQVRSEGILGKVLRSVLGLARFARAVNVLRGRSRILRSCSNGFDHGFLAEFEALAANFPGGVGFGFCLLECA